jgi:hypothetical protein
MRDGSGSLGVEFRECLRACLRVVYAVFLVSMYSVISPSDETFVYRPCPQPTLPP